MNLDAIKNSPVGSLVPIDWRDPRTGEHQKHKAFVPEPLPTEIDLESGTWQIVVRAATALSQLDQAGTQIPNPDLFRRPTLRREAQSTSALEGTHAPFTELLEADLESDDARLARSGALREVLNYVRAAEFAFDWISDRPITEVFIAGLQKTLVQRTRGELDDAGRVRTRQVVVGPEGCTANDARYVPPPPGDLLQSGVDAWIKWVNSDLQMPDVVRAALAHYQFEALHPFSDGNGRIGRLLVVLQLMHSGALRDSLLIVSPWFEARRREYQDHLLYVSETGDFDTWIAFFCEGIRAQAVATLARVQALLDYQAELRELVHSRPLRGVAARIAEGLIGNAIVTPSWAKTHYGVSYQAANTAIAKLVEEGVLTELTGRKYARLFASERALAIVED